MRLRHVTALLALAILVGGLLWWALDMPADTAPSATIKTVTAAPSEQADVPPELTAPPSDDENVPSAQPLLQPVSPPAATAAAGTSLEVALQNWKPSAGGAALAFRMDMATEDDWQPTAAGKRHDFEQATLVVSPLLEGRHTWFLQVGKTRLLEGAVDIAAGANRLTIDMGRLAGYSGRVVDAVGQPLMGVDVTVNGSTGMGRQDVLGTTSSDAAGRFRLELLPPGVMHHIKFGRPGWIPEELGPFCADGAGPTDLGDVVLHPGHVVAGSVFGPGGVALPGCPVKMIADGKLFESRADDEGHYRFAEATALTGWVTSNHDKLLNDQHALEELADPRQAHLHLTAGDWLSGTAMLASGKPANRSMLEGFPVLASGPPEGWQAAGLARFGNVSDEGDFRMGPFPPGLVEVRDTFVTRFTQVVPTDREAHLILPDGREWGCTVRLVARDSGLPVTERGHYLLSYEGGARGQSSFTPDASGTWTLTARTLPSLPIDLLVSVPGYGPAKRVGIDLEVDGGLAVFELDPVPTLDFEVTDGAGRPCPAALICVAVVRSVPFMEVETYGYGHANPAWLDGEPTMVKSGSTDAVGRLSLDMPVESPCRYTVTAPGFLPHVGDRPESTGVVAVTMLSSTAP